MVSTEALHTTRVHLPNATTILIMLGNALMAEGLCRLLQLHGYRCWVGESHAEPDVIIVDTATIDDGLSLRYPRARILFLRMEQDPSRVAALLSWHRVHGIIPPSAGLQGFAKTLQAVSEGRFRVRQARLCALSGTEVPVPFTRMEKKVIACICRGDSTKEIAQGLHLSPHTVKMHVRNILAKTGAQNRASLINLLGACAGGESDEK